MLECMKQGTVLKSDEVASPWVNITPQVSQSIRPYCASCVSDISLLLLQMNENERTAAFDAKAKELLTDEESMKTALQGLYTAGWDQVRVLACVSPGPVTLVPLPHLVPPHSYRTAKRSWKDSSKL